MSANRSAAETDDGVRPGDGSVPPVLEVIGAQRRAPFGENPTVGARGARTQHRILAAALDVFGETGYRGCAVERITAVAGCSRPSFYQYFSNKEDLFRQLAGEVARAVYALTDDLDEVTPDRAGWESLRAWLARYADLYDRFWPVFAAFSEAEGSDEVLAAASARVSARQNRKLLAHVGAGFRAERPEAVATIVFNTVARANRYRRLLDDIDAPHAPGREPFLDGLAEVLHRILFGRRGGGFVPHVPARPPAWDGAPPRDAVTSAVGDGALGVAGQHTRQRLLDAAAGVFATRGYHETRVDDVVGAADVSHGTFYRYFHNKDHVFRIVAGRAGRRVYSALDELPDVAGAPSSPSAARALRRWLEAYVETYVEEGPVFRVWVEALGGDRELTAATAAAMDAIRARLARFLDERPFGDAEIEAFLLLAMLDLTDFRSLRNAAAGSDSLDLMVAVLRRGFLGVDARL